MLDLLFNLLLSKNVHILLLFDIPELVKVIDKNRGTDTVINYPNGLKCIDPYGNFQIKRFLHSHSLPSPSPFQSIDSIFLTDLL